MAVSSVERRLERYLAWLSRGRSAYWRKRKLPRIAARARQGFARQVALETAVRAILANEPVNMMDYPRYYNFARHLCCKLRGLAPALRAQVAEEAYEHWIWQGCKPEVLLSIQSLVFAEPWLWSY
ncbi:MAG: hypothetical protein ABIK62_00470 [candidate division WOR-3 bacterium]